MSRGYKSVLFFIAVVIGIFVFAYIFTPSAEYESTHHGIVITTEQVHAMVIKAYARGYADGYYHLRPVDPAFPKGLRDSLQTTPMPPKALNQLADEER